VSGGEESLSITNSSHSTTHCDAMGSVPFLRHPNERIPPQCGSRPTRSASTTL
jgi:hypothetical protein